MSNKLIEFNLKGLEKLQVGLNKAADAIKSTLGPFGKYVIIGQARNRPRFTKDGVSVAKAIQFEDPFENAGAQIIIEAAEKTVLNVGDGTTATAIMAQTLFNEGLKYAKEGSSIISKELKLLDEQLPVVLKTLDNVTVKLKGVKDQKVAQIATISTNNDSVLGDLISRGFKEAGDQGVLFVEEGKLVTDKIEVKDGIELKAGWIHPAFINNPTNSKCEFEGSYLVICEDILADETQVLGLVTRLWPANQPRKPITILARGYTDPVLGFLVVNRVKSNYTFPLLAISADDLGIDSKEVLRDFAEMYGVHPVSNELNVQLPQLEAKDILWVDRISASRKSVTVLAQSKNKEKLKGKLEEFKNRLKEEDDPYERVKLENRIGTLTGKVVTIQIGGKTRMEISEKRDRVDDAASAVKSALESGVVVGGGLALAGTSEFINSDLLDKALNAPISQLYKNAGLTWIPRDCIIKDQIVNEKGLDFFHSYKDNSKYIDYMQAGILDPVNAVKESLLNAVSVAKLLLNSSAVIVDEVVKESVRDK